MVLNKNLLSLFGRICQTKTRCLHRKTFRQNLSIFATLRGNFVLYIIFLNMIQPAIRWVFRRVDLKLRCASKVYINPSKYHFPVGQGLDVRSFLPAVSDHSSDCFGRDGDLMKIKKIFARQMSYFRVIETYQIYAEEEI